VNNGASSFNIIFLVFLFFFKIEWLLDLRCLFA
jgi:hypothetical protein